MSFYFAGSAQFVTVSMLTGGSYLIYCVSDFLSKCAYDSYGMTIAPYFKAESLGKISGWEPY